MRYAGIAWTSTGFDVALLDDAGTPAAPATSFRRVPALLDYLRGLDQPDLICVVESTNGMIDSGMTASGLRVYRADPAMLPPRPAFGSVTASAIAMAAVHRLDELERLTVQGGSLSGRNDEYIRTIKDSEPDVAVLEQAGRWIAHGDRSGEDKVIALTFDDGPNPPYTGQILDVLDSYDVRATFFCVGLHASAHPDELARMAAAGHQLGNHTWSHAFLPDLSISELAAQLDRTTEVLACGAGGASRPLFRPPYGSYSPQTMSWLLGQQNGPTVVLWDNSPDDWALPGSDAIVKAVLDHAQPGSIVLMHDGGGDRSQTAQALPAVIEGLLIQGYRFVPVDDLIK